VSLSGNASPVRCARPGTLAPPSTNAPLSAPGVFLAWSGLGKHAVAANPLSHLTSPQAAVNATLCSLPVALRPEWE